MLTLLCPLIPLFAVVVAAVVVVVAAVVVVVEEVVRGNRIGCCMYNSDNLNWSSICAGDELALSTYQNEITLMDSKYLNNCSNKWVPYSSS